jgi:hypothetical protein
MMKGLFFSSRAYFERMFAHCCGMRRVSALPVPMPKGMFAMPPHQRGMACCLPTFCPFWDTGAPVLYLFISYSLIFRKVSFAPILRGWRLPR